MEIYAGEKATRVYGSDDWLPEETLEAAREYPVGIKVPLTTPIGGGIRLNVALRQQLDLYVCLRPVRYFAGDPSPVKYPADEHGHLPRERGGHLRGDRVAGRRNAREEIDSSRTRWAPQDRLPARRPASGSSR